MTQQTLSEQLTGIPTDGTIGEQTKDMLINVGPSHPAMHGIIRIIMRLDGEIITGCETEIGYLHRAFEKMSETVPYNSVMPYTDRLNYVSPLINNVGYCMAVEKLIGLEIPERTHYIRVIVSEISRITDHLTCVGASAMELGAFTVFLYMIKAREYLWELVESVTGARLTVSYCRVGGVKGDLPADFEAKTRKALADTRDVLVEVEKLLNRNRIFIDRMKGTGVISAEDAVGYGITGPFLRGSGVDYDVRKNTPYAVYDQLDFDVPLGQHGDNLDRYYVRLEEMYQSMRIIEQCFDKMPGGPVLVDPETGRPVDPKLLEDVNAPTDGTMPAAEFVDKGKMGHIREIRGKQPVIDPTLEGADKNIRNQMATDNKGVYLPPKEDTYGNIEGLMNHFKLVMFGHGIRAPKGEVYFPVEGANGELGFYVVSDGADKAYRVRVRPPCFTIMSALEKLLIGDQIADLVPTFGSINMIGGELDR